MAPPGKPFATAPEVSLTDERMEAVGRAIEGGELGIVFQPVADLRSKCVFGYEALARPRSPLFSGPQDLYHTAARMGRVGELGLVFRRMAIQHCPLKPLFLNIFPNEFDEGYLVRTDDPIFRHRAPIYLEIVEALPLSHFEQCHGVLEEIRARGCMLAIDDLGAGYSNLKYIAELKPEIVKLDRDLVAGVRRDTRQFSLLRSIARLCRDMAAKVVVEGVETVGELEVAGAIGADFCQGYFLARPAFPPPDIPASVFR